MPTAALLVVIALCLGHNSASAVVFGEPFQGTNGYVTTFSHEGTCMPGCGECSVCITADLPPGYSESEIFLTGWSITPADNQMFVRIKLAVEKMSYNKTTGRFSGRATVDMGHPEYYPNSAFDWHIAGTIMLTDSTMSMNRITANVTGKTDRVYGKNLHTYDGLPFPTGGSFMTAMKSIDVRATNGKPIDLSDLTVEIDDMADESTLNFSCGFEGIADDGTHQDMECDVTWVRVVSNGQNCSHGNPDGFDSWRPWASGTGLTAPFSQQGVWVGEDDHFQFPAFGLNYFGISPSDRTPSRPGKIAAGLQNISASLTQTCYAYWDWIGDFRIYDSWIPESYSIYNGASLCVIE